MWLCIAKYIRDRSMVKRCPAVSSTPELSKTRLGRILDASHFPRMAFRP